MMKSKPFGQSIIDFTLELPKLPDESGLHVRVRDEIDFYHVNTEGRTSITQTRIVEVADLHAYNPAGVPVVLGRLEINPGYDFVDEELRRGQSPYASLYSVDRGKNFEMVSQFLALALCVSGVSTASVRSDLYPALRVMRERDWKNYMPVPERPDQCVNMCAPDSLQRRDMDTVQRVRLN